MMRLRAFYSHLNTPLSIKNNRLFGYQSKAPVHWGVNATAHEQTTPIRPGHMALGSHNPGADT